MHEALYVPVDTSGGQILTFIFDSGAGTLSANGTSMVGPPTGLDIKVDPTGNFVYASDFNTNSIYGYSIDPTTGGLTAIAGSPFPFPGTTPPFRGNGGPLAIDPSGKYVFYSDAHGSITFFNIDGATGALSPTSAAVVDGCVQPMHMLGSPSGRFLYAANLGGNSFCIYSINLSTGALTPLPGSPFSFVVNSLPWGLAMNAGGTFLYSSLSNSQQVAGFSVDTTAGTLTQLTGSPYPAGFIPQGIALGAGGQYLYVGNEGNGTISMFKVDPTTGVLSTNGSLAAGNPSFLATDTSGQYLFVLGQSSGQLTAYKIDSMSGSLTNTSTASAGTSNGPSLAVFQLK